MIETFKIIEDDMVEYHMVNTKGMATTKPFPKRGIQILTVNEDIRSIHYDSGNIEYTAIYVKGRAQF